VILCRWVSSDVSKGSVGLIFKDWRVQKEWHIPWAPQPLKVKAIRSFETSGKISPATKLRIPKDLNPAMFSWWRKPEGRFMLLTILINFSAHQKTDNAECTIIYFHIMVKIHANYSYIFWSKTVQLMVISLIQVDITQGIRLSNIIQMQNNSW
jgi:hypothetical protein